MLWRVVSRARRYLYDPGATLNKAVSVPSVGPTGVLPSPAPHDRGSAAAVSSCKRAEERGVGGGRLPGRSHQSWAVPWKCCKLDTWVGHHRFCRTTSRAPSASSRSSVPSSCRSPSPPPPPRSPSLSLRCCRNKMISKEHGSTCRWTSISLCRPLQSMPAATYFESSPFCPSNSHTQQLGPHHLSPQLTCGIGGPPASVHIRRPAAGKSNSHLVSRTPPQSSPCGRVAPLLLCHSSFVLHGAC